MASDNLVAELLGMVRRIGEQETRLAVINNRMDDFLKDARTILKAIKKGGLHTCPSCRHEFFSPEGKEPFA